MSMSVEEGNKLIGDFMGKDFKDPLNYMYDKSWDWFHGAWDKFKTIQLKEWDGEGVKWNHRFSFYLTQIGSAMAHLPILNAFERLVEGIQWYNTQPLTKKEDTNE